MHVASRWKNAKYKRFSVQGFQMLHLRRHFNHTKYMYLAICYGESSVNKMLGMWPMTGLLHFIQPNGKINPGFTHAYVLHWVLFRVLKMEDDAE